MFQVVFPAACALSGVVIASVFSWVVQRRSTMFRARLDAYSNVMTQFVLWLSHRDTPAMEAAIASAQRARLLAKPVTETILLDCTTYIAGETTASEFAPLLVELQSAFRKELKKV